MKTIRLFVIFTLFVIFDFSGCSPKEYVSSNGTTLTLGKKGHAVLTNNTKGEMHIKTKYNTIGKISGWDSFAGFIGSYNVRFENTENLEKIESFSKKTFSSYDTYIIPSGKSIELTNLDFFKDTNYNRVYFHLYYTTDEGKEVLFYVCLRGKEDRQFELELLESSQLELLGVE